MKIHKLGTYRDLLTDRQFEMICRHLSTLNGFGETDVAITVTGTAGGTYTAAEQGMINALAADMATLRDEINDLKALLNA